MFAEVNMFSRLKDTIQIEDEELQYFNLLALNDKRYGKIPSQTIIIIWILGVDMNWIQNRIPFNVLHCIQSQTKDNAIPIFFVADRLPFSIRVLLESAIRNCDNFHINEKDVENIMNWQENQNNAVEVPFKPSRVILQDFTWV